MSDIAVLSVTVQADAKKFDATLAAAEAALKRFNAESGAIKSKLPAAGAGPADELNKAAIAAAKLATEQARAEGQLLKNARAAQQLAAATERAGKTKLGGGEDLEKSTAAMQRAERQALAFAQARARLLADSGDLAGAERVLQGALDATTQSTTATIAAQRQLLAVQKQVAAAADGGGGSAKGGFIASLGSEVTGLIGAVNPATAAIAGIAAATVGAGAAMLDTAERVRTIKGALGELTPEDILAVDNAAVLLSQRFGVDLAEQVRAARVVMQTFGTDGAGAMDILAAGFENGLNAGEDFADTLQEYSGYFRDLGLSADDTLNIIDRGLDAGARNADFIGDAVKELGIKLGEAGTAATLAPISEELASLVLQFQQGAIDGPEAFAAIVDGITAIEDPVARQTAGVALFGTKFEDLGVTAITAMGQVDQALISSANAADLAGQRITSLGEIFPRLAAGVGSALQPVNDAIIGLANTFLLVSTAGDQAAVAASQVFADSGGDYEAYRARLAEINLALAEIGQTQEPLTRAQYVYAQALQAGGTAAADAAREAAAFGEQTVILADGTSVVEERTGALAEAEALLAENLRRAATEGENDASVKRDQADAAIEVESSLLAQAAATLQAEAESTALARAQQVLADLGGQVAGGHITAGDAALVLAQRYGIASAEALKLINLQATLARSAQVAAAGFASVPEGYLGAATGKGTGLGPSNAVLKQLEDARAEAAAIYNRSLREVQVPGSTGGRGGGGGGAGGGTKPRKGRAGAAGKSEAEKAAEKEARAAEQLQEKLAAIEERAYEARLAAETRYQEERASIIADYAEREKAASESLIDSQLEGRADFYNSLRGIEDEGARARASAAFEEGEARAGQLEQTQGADVAEDYREANADVVQARAQREAEIAKLREEGKAGEAKYLEDVDKLYRESENRRLERIAAGEGSLDDQKAAALTEAEAQRQKAIEDAAVKAGDALSEAQAKATKAATLTNEALQKQLALLQQTGGAPPPGLPAAPAATPAPAAATATGEAPALPGATANGGPVAVTSPSIEDLLERIATSMQEVARRLKSSPNYSPGA